MNNFKSCLPLALFPVGDGFAYVKPPDVSSSHAARCMLQVKKH